MRDKENTKKQVLYEVSIKLHPVQMSSLIKWVLMASKRNIDRN
jgi:hypothetical protein